MKSVWILWFRSTIHDPEIHTVFGDEQQANNLMDWLAKRHPDSKYWITEYAVN